jgi:hypothetical protein
MALVVIVIDSEIIIRRREESDMGVAPFLADKSHYRYAGGDVHSPMALCDKFILGPRGETLQPRIFQEDANYVSLVKPE